jgi:hypothetical protein
MIFKKKEEDEKIYCPICTSPLRVTHQGRYEDLSEHVSNPNGTPSLKDGYQCTNVDWCEASKLNITWIEDGDCFIRPPEHISYGEALRTLKSKSVSGMTHALNSFNHHYEEGKNAIKKWTKISNIGKFRFEFAPKEYGWKYPERKRYQPCLWKWKFTMWRKTGDHTFEMLIPVHERIYWTIRNFLTNYKSSIYNPKANRYSIKDCLHAMGDLNDGFVDNLTHKKFSAFLIRILYPGKCEVVRILAKKEGILK